MEEIDGIIIDSLKNLNCDLEEGVISLKQFDADRTVAAISACLGAILPDVSFPKKMPPSMSSKLKVSSTLAEQIKDLGFRGDMGYQTILYCNEAEVRRVLMFLIERLPRESSKMAQVEQTGYVPTLVKEIERKVKQSLQQLWVPPCILHNGCRPTDVGNIVSSLGNSRPLHAKSLRIPPMQNYLNYEAEKQYWIHTVPAVTKQCSEKEFIPSLLFDDCRVNWSDTSLRSCLNMTRMHELPEPLLVESKLTQQNGIGLQPIPQEVLAPTKNKLRTLVHSLHEKQAKYLELQDTVNKYEAHLSRENQSQLEEEEQLKQSITQVNLKTKTLTVISKEENLDKLKQLIETSKNKLVSLTERWNQVQAPLLEEYKSLRNTLSREDSKAQKQQKKFRKFEDIQQNLTVALKEKLLLEEQLKEKLEQVNKTHNRSGYTRRILEIIGNVKKQDEEIQKILKDTREVQREINALTGQVDRSFTLSDELIFRDAKQDETARKAYKLLAQLRDECSSIIKAVTGLGTIERECRNLQEQIDIEMAKDSAVKLDRVNKDLQELRKETEIHLTKASVQF